jgi:hypothetical protein
LPKDIECPGGYELYTHREFLEDGPDECKCGYKPYDTTAGQLLSGGVDGQDAYCAPKIECLACCDTDKYKYTREECEISGMILGSDQCTEDHITHIKRYATSCVCDTSKGQYDTDAACKASKAHSTCTKNGNCYEVSGCETGYTMSNSSCVKNSGGGSSGNPCLGKSGGYVCSQNDKWYSSESGCSSVCGGSTKCLKCGSGNKVEFEFDGEIYGNEAVGSVTTRNPACPANCDFFYQTHRGCVTQCEGGQGPVVYDCIACILTTGGSSLTR